MTKNLLYTILNFFTVFVLLYIFVNNPVLKISNGIGLVKFLYPLAFIVLLWKNKLLTILINFKIEICLFFLIIIFSIFSSSIAGEYDYSRSFIVSFIECILLTNFFYYAFYQNDKNKWISNLVAVGVVGAIISIYCLVDIPFNIEIKNLQIADDFSTENTFRNFGLASNLTYSYGLTQAIILLLMMFFFKHNYRYILFILMIAISILINARTGFIIVGVTTIYFLISRKKIKLTLYIVLFSVIIVNIFNNITIDSEFEKTISWVTDFFKEIGDLFSTTKNADYSTADVLLNDMFVLPENFTEWIVGSAKSSFGLAAKGTDVGFWQQLKYGGIIFTMLLSSLVAIMSVRIYNSKKNTWFLVMSLIVYFIGNFKGYYLLLSGGFKLIFLIYVILMNEYIHRRKGQNIVISEQNINLNL